jgi:hypothetical protein
MAPISTNDLSVAAQSETTSGENMECFEDHDKVEPIAVVGFSFGFPQEAVSSEAFWEMMMNKRGSCTKIPPERFNSAAMYHQDASRKGQASFPERNNRA